MTPVGTVSNKRMSPPVKQFVAALRQRFAASASPKDARAMKAYLRDQFDFFGVKSPERRRLVRDFLSEAALPELPALKSVVSLMWREPEREMQHTAMEILQLRIDELTLEDLPLLRQMITHKSWWDTVDFISYKLVGQLLLKHPGAEASVARDLANSGNLWLLRVSILFQLLRKERTDAGLLADVIRQHADHPDFFIRKAIGWALRDYARTDPVWVQDFVARTRLSPLSVREATKHL